MKRTVKSLVLFTCLLCNGACFSQLKINAPDGVAADIKKIITAFPDHFSTYRGDVIVQNPQSTDYTCTMKVNGAEESSFTNYSGKKEIWSWQALMLTTESFDKAKQKFRSLFNQLNNLSINGNFRLEGKYESPAEEKKFTNVVFTPSTERGDWAKIRAEVLMEFSAPMEWKVKLLVYDRDREDEQEGQRDR